MHVHKVTCVGKIQIYLPSEELAALRKRAKRSGRSVAALVREAIRQVVLQQQRHDGPVALWDGQPKRASIDHDSVHGQPSSRSCASAPR